jgi:PAS domain S-box-containing protein
VLPLKAPDLNDHGAQYWRQLSQTTQALPSLDAALPSDAEFRLLADHLPSPCWLARGDGYVIWYSKRWHDYCGSSPDAMAGWGWQSVHDRERLPDVLERWTASIASGQPFEMTFPLRGADGRFRPFLTRVAPLRDGTGRVVRWFGVNTEVGGQARAEAALRASEAKFSVLADAMPQMVWSTLPDGHHDYYNAQWYDFTGVPEGSTDGEGWAGMFHPDDQEQAWDRWRHSLATGEPYETEYRLRHRSGEYRWTLGRALPVRDEAGRILRWIGTCTDIDAARRTADENQVLSRELAHRIKNIFAVISGLVRLSSRQQPAARAFARDLDGRIAALGRAHEFARPHSEESKPVVGDTTLHGLLADLFSPYAADSRITVRGDDVPVDDHGATPIALVFHELATNAMKYGALSASAGSVVVEVQRDGDELLIRWREAGGPTLSGVPAHEGFGTKLAILSVKGQLGGEIRREWRTEGLQVELSLRASGLTRPRKDAPRTA